jgi:hypothetical protein
MLAVPDLLGCLQLQRLPGLECFNAFALLQIIDLFTVLLHAAPVKLAAPAVWQFAYNCLNMDVVIPFDLLHRLVFDLAAHHVAQFEYKEQG